MIEGTELLVSAGVEVPEKHPYTGAPFVRAEVTEHGRRLFHDDARDKVVFVVRFVCANGDEAQYIGDANGLKCTAWKSTEGTRVRR